MPLQVYRLRRWLATIAALFTAVIAGMYYSARQHRHNFLKEVPGKIGYDVKQTAKGFQFSKSEGGRTLFTIEASDLRQFKLDGRAELHKVSIVLYGRDSARFDRISGDDFTYDPKSGDVRANGDVQIDLEANPTGLGGPDQGAPQELSNSIHLKTRDLVFNKETGNASTDARIEFQTPQATGWAVGVQYGGRTNALLLNSQIHLLITGTNASVIRAARGVVTGEPRQIVLDHPNLERKGESLRADEATLVLGLDNSVERVFAHGDVTAQVREEAKTPNLATNLTPSAALDTEQSHSIPAQAAVLRVRANEGDLSLGKQNRLQRATLAGDVHFERTGPQPMQGDAGSVDFDFSQQNQLRTVHADKGVRLWQLAASEAPRPSGLVPQNFELSAPVVDFFVAKGHLLQRALTSGRGQITITPGQGAGSGRGKTPHTQRTVINARKFEARFEVTPEGLDRLASIQGAPEARIVSSDPGKPGRVSDSDSVDANFLAQGGIESITQEGHVVYTDAQAPGKQTQAWADRARYTPGDQVLVLTGKPTGKPRVTDGSMTTTATTIRISRSTGDAIAEGDVKSTYSQIQEQAQGALLASAAPIHVAADSMIAHSKPAVALYSGNARLWQDANIIKAPSIEFDRECRCVTAQGTPEQPVSTTIVQSGKVQPEGVDPARAAPAKDAQKKSVASSARSSPVFLSGSRLTYADSERRVHYEGGVTARGTDFTASAKTMDLYLAPRRDSAKTPYPYAQSPAQLDRIVAQDDVVIQQPTRRALGQTLLYESTLDKFTLTGGPPSIFDAERGKITGVSLTFFRADDRVLVEGAASSPVVTQTRVAR